MVKRLLTFMLMILLMVGASACSASAEPNPRDIAHSIELAYPNLTFERPIYFAAANDASGEVYVVEQAGKILIFTDSAETTSADVFLDLSELVNAGGQEQGLLGLAFHPNYTDNGYFYVNYTDENGTIIARYTRDSNDTRKADPLSGVVMLSFDQPYANHNGGQLAFGPGGYLYIATGDGGSGGDPENNAQNLTNLLGKILRIDVDTQNGGMMYAIPSDNPFFGNDEGNRAEIFAYGLRNPWRFSFDSEGTLWVADVGQGQYEEIDHVVSGGNYGWSVKEGFEDYETVEGIDTAELIDPIHAYDHSVGTCITGGYVYEGSVLPELQGTYIYGDYVSGRIWALWIPEDGGFHSEVVNDSDLNISSFGLTADGEIRIVDYSGQIYKISAVE